MDMLTDCAMFRPVHKETFNYYQLSGPPIFDLEPIPSSKTAIAQAYPKGGPAGMSIEERTPCEITFVRSRMFYAKAALNARGDVRFGMRHIR
jgi:telomerase reverse transcriptase